MNLSKTESSQSYKRRDRLHQILIALINQQNDLELMDEASPFTETSRTSSQIDSQGKWLDRNQRILKKYQSLVRSAIALDALLESEQC